ncbi:MAG: tryptophan--tRNA ligase [Oligoflexia bacterium]|nr:tryptophan--tRNA ligase [Oligoflexia bacterium]
MKKILTGIKPTGTPHLGNYLGAIRPALEFVENESRNESRNESGLESYYFMADYHALTTVHDPKVLKNYIREVAATWLAFGLNVDKTVFFRQSDIPQVMELSWILACFTSKGLMNRAHAYKALLEQNSSNEDDPDAGINMGIYTYPILMAADILLFDTDLVPVGQDQVQHIEIARDIAKAFNSRYATEGAVNTTENAADILKLPTALIRKEVAVLPGLDGRKMSKSYNNTIPLFLPSEKLRKLIMKIKTDSTDPSAPKNPDDSLIFTIYAGFASEEQKSKMRERFLSGISWGVAKQELFELMDSFLHEPREKYNLLINNPDEIDKLLLKGKEKALVVAQKTIDRLRLAIGIN